MLTTKSSDKVLLGTCVGWGIGGLAEYYMMNALIVLVMPIYNIALGMDPVKLGIALSIPQFIEAIACPIMGNVSDNTRSRFGRRRPYIFAGAILTAIIFPLIWMPPARTEMALFWYFTITASIYSLMYTVFSVPYAAFGYELASSYDERTRVLAWQQYLSLAGCITVPWLYKLCLLDMFGNAVDGAVWVGVAIGFVIMVTGILPAIMCKERPGNQKQRKIGLVNAMIHTAKNKPYLVLLGGFITIVLGLFSGGVALGLYLNIYYVCQGDKSLAATICGMSGSLIALTAFISLPLITWVSVRWSKRDAMIAGLGFMLLGTTSLWLTLSPSMPYLQLISSFIIGIGMQGCWLMIGSMVADICDEDEVMTGLRREGVYGAVLALAVKGAMALAAVMGGILIKITGYDAMSAAKTGIMSPDVISRMKIIFVFGQGSALVIAIVIFSFYPLTRRRSEEIRRIIDAQKAAKASSYIAELCSESAQTDKSCLISHCR